MRVFSCLSIVVLCAIAQPGASQCSRAWQRGLPPIDAWSLLYATAVYDDGTGPALYVGGLIDEPAEGIARLDGAQFVGVGGGVHHVHGGYTEVHAMTVYNGELIVAGDFSVAGSVPAANIARWNGTRWAALGEGSREIVYALTVHEGRLIAGRQAWNGTTWTPLSGGANIGTTLALAVHDGALIAGGDGAPYVARWDGAAWSALGGGTNHFVEALTIFEGDLIAGGYFTAAGGVPATSVARWNGSAWSPVGPPSDLRGAVLSLTTYEDTIVAGGYFRSTASGPARVVARWTPAAGVWTNMGTGFNYFNLDDTVHAFAEFEGDLVAVGVFPGSPGYPANRNWGRWTCAAAPNQAPVANPGPPVTGQLNRTVVLYGTSSFDPDGDGLEFYWNYGDGSTSAGVSRVGMHAYTTPGTYTATLVVHDGELASAPVTTTVTITGVNQPPIVSLTSPAASAQFAAPAAITVAANAADLDGTISRVEFFAGTTSLGVDSAAPYTVTWTGVAAGRYAITAVARDNGGAVAATSPVNVVVAAALAPLADAYVRDGASAGSSFGGGSTLEVRTSTTGNTRWTYLRFDTSALTSVSSVKLRLNGAVSQTSSQQVRTAAFAASPSSWTESSLTWNSRPAIGSIALATVTLVNSTTARWYEWDVTQYVQQERAAGRTVVTIALRNTTTTSAQAAFRSREAASNRPQLVIVP